jgi:bifunctional DNA-binding transcriptional regulator/antitoxin component of YhaV-PrlF toxin-antitoxin module
MCYNSSESWKVGISEERGNMARKQITSKLVRLQAKGQVTLPAEFRRRLNVDDDAILRVTLQEDGLTITPLRSERADPPLREYSQADIDRFLREDRLDKATAAKVRRLLSGKQAA